MPLKLNVGSSRKLTDNNYGSRGASVNLEVELDMALVADPPKLRSNIRHLFQVVRASLVEELDGGGHPVNGQNGSVVIGEHASGERSAANGTPAHPDSREAGPRPATAGQCNAIYAIARALGVSLADYLSERFQAQRPEDLTLRQASEAIDDLRAAGAGGIS